MGLEMKLCLYMLIITVYNTSAKEIRDEHNVLLLDDSNIDDIIKKYKHIMIEFYAPWCSHCKRLEPEYSKASVELIKTTINLAKIDGTVNPGVGPKFGIKGYPTLIYFESGKRINYMEGRTSKEIVAWLKNIAKDDPSTHLKTIEEVEEFKKSDDIVVVFFGNLGIDTYFSYSKQVENIKFGYCNSSECISNYNVIDGTVVLFKNFDNNRADLVPGFRLEEFKKFIADEKSPLIYMIDEKNSNIVFKDRIPGLFFFYERQANIAKELEEILDDVAVYAKSHGVQLFTLDKESPVELKVLEYLNIKATEFPLVALIDARNKLKVNRLSGKITSASVKELVQHFVEDKLEKKIKSEEIPAEQTSPVFKLVGKSFNIIVKNPKLDVLVKYYAPWCGHCQKFAPEYEAMAKLLTKSNPNLIIAEIDCTKNDTDNFQIGAFPSFHLWPAGENKKYIYFKGERSTKGLINFLKENATHKIEIKDDL